MMKYFEITTQNKVYQEKCDNIDAMLIEAIKDNDINHLWRLSILSEEYYFLDNPVTGETLTIREM